LPENKTGLTGIYYQKFIRWGIKGQNFICISKKTQSDLHLLLQTFKTSQVVYNGLNQN
jgi:hypothetical protein